MPIATKQNGRTVVLVPDSSITWRTQPELKEALDELSANGQKQIIIDLSNVREISGYGLGLLASRCGRLRREAGDIKLANASESVRKLLEMTNLDALFEQFDSADSAIRSFTVIGILSDEDEEE